MTIGKTRFGEPTSFYTHNQTVNIPFWIRASSLQRLGEMLKGGVEDICAEHYFSHQYRDKRLGVDICVSKTLPHSAIQYWPLKYLCFVCNATWRWTHFTWTQLLNWVKRQQTGTKWEKWGQTKSNAIGGKTGVKRIKRGWWVVCCIK